MENNEEEVDVNKANVEKMIEKHKSYYVAYYAKNKDKIRKKYHDSKGDEKKYVCSLCNYSTHLKGALKRHKETKKHLRNISIDNEKDGEVKEEI